MTCTIHRVAICKLKDLGITQISLFQKSGNLMANFYLKNTIKLNILTMKVIKKFYNLDYTNIQKTPNNSLNVDKSRETWTDGNPSLTETFIH